MATDGEVEGRVAGKVDSEDLFELLCQPCHEDGEIREAVGMCLDCQDYLCQACYDVHKTPKPTRNHELINKEQMLKSQVPIARKDKCTEKCDKHGEKTIKYYCKNHCQLICSVCINLHHRSCDGVTYIPHVAKDLGNNEYFKQAESRLKSTVDNAEHMLGKVTQTADGYYEECSLAEKTVQILRKDMNDALDKIEADLVRQIGTKKSEMSDRMTKLTAKVSTTQKELHRLTTITNSLQHRGQNCELFTFLMKSKDKLQALDDDLKQTKTDQTGHNLRVKFISNREIIDSLKDPEILGRLVETETRNDEAAIDTRTVVKAEHMNNIHVKTGKDKMCCYISGSAVLPDNKLLLADYNNRCIKYVDTNSNKVIKDLRLTYEPWDIALITNSQAAVTIPSEKQIVFVETKPTTMTVQRTVYVMESCLGIDYREDKLAVTITFSNKVQILNLQGALLHIIENTQGQNLLNKPYYVTFGHDSSTLYVSNFTKHNVVCVKVDGTVVATYEDSMLQHPKGIITDKRGNVYVCDQISHNIHQLTDCRKIKILLSETDGLNQPHSISFNETENMLFVSMWNNDVVKVYKCFHGAP